MRRRVLVATGLAVLLAASLGGCTGLDRADWDGRGYYASRYWDRPYPYWDRPYSWGRPYWDRPYWGGPSWAERRAFRHDEGRPRVEHWSQDRLRQHWCRLPGARC